jgi:hypothetical protein
MRFLGFPVDSLDSTGFHPDPLDLTNEPHPRFPVQGHILLVEMLSHLQEERNKYDLTAGPCF